MKFFKGTAAEVAASAKTGTAGDLVTESDTGNISVADGSTLLGALKRLVRFDEVPILSSGKVPEANIPDRLSESGLSASTDAALIAHETALKVGWADIWGPLFDNGNALYLGGQKVSQTTTTSAVSDGAFVLPLADVTNVVAGQVFVTNSGTADQQTHRVVSVASNNVTVRDPISPGLASGQTVGSLWINVNHLTFDDTQESGIAAMAYIIANATDPDGNYLIQGTAPKVTLLGNSWFRHGDGFAYDQLEDCILDRIPGAAVVNAGVGGNTTQMILDRFDTDVPADSDYVVIFEHVNDAYADLARDVQADHWQTLARKARALGATPIIVSPPPLVQYQARAVNQMADRQAQFQEGTTWPAIGSKSLTDALAALAFRPNSTSLGIGNYALLKADVATGTSNVAVGAESQREVITGRQNTSIGHGALNKNVTGIGNTAGGQLAGYNATGNHSVFLGFQSAYSPNSVGANATTTGFAQTLLGALTGQGSTTARNYITCLGYKTTADGAGAVAIGTDSGGVGAAATTANEIALGTANHFVKVRGRTETAASTTTTAGLRVAHGAAPTTPVDGDVWTTTAGLFVRVNGVTKTVTLT